MLRHLPRKRQTLFFSATMPAPIAQLTREMLHDPVDDQSRAPFGARQGHHPGGLSGRAVAQSAAAAESAADGDVRDALVFTRTKHRADRLAKYLAAHRVTVERIHGNRSQAQRTAGARRFQGGKLPGPRGHRHRGTRDRRDRARPRHQLRRAGAAPRTTSTASAAPRARS